MKNFIKHLFRSIGYEVVPYGVAGSNRRPICNLKAFLEDIRARSFRPKLILDVGANRGDWTRMTKDIFPEARFLLVEPQVEMKNSLNGLCSEFEDISWVEAGAGSELIEFMGERGYEIYDIAGYLRRPFDGALGQVDLAFAKREGILRRSNKW